MTAVYSERIAFVSAITRLRSAVTSITPLRARSMIRVATASRPRSSPAKTCNAVQASSNAFDIATTASGSNVLVSDRCSRIGTGVLLHAIQGGSTTVSQPPTPRGRAAAGGGTFDLTPKLRSPTYVRFAGTIFFACGGTKPHLL